MELRKTSDAAIGGKLLLQIETSQRTAVVHPMKLIWDLEPVSYTHLDVYKRQRFDGQKSE